eukprot:CAMPEP_0119291266 /NCGR_PEP_ID=MMETSP1329-20130426/42180_1 /TAXON_ID=114041 /ORGANISM="Genus nov. species nov., Strain RCC1024" /LENGTH=43 /DNA_ID= /DNA_START= /DNA_END= /DNA_ORIENTATION=
MDRSPFVSREALLEAKANCGVFVAASADAYPENLADLARRRRD